MGYAKPSVKYTTKYMHRGSTKPSVKYITIQGSIIFKSTVG